MTGVARKGPLTATLHAFAAGCQALGASPLSFRASAHIPHPSLIIPAMPGEARSGGDGEYADGMVQDPVGACLALVQG